METQMKIKNCPSCFRVLPENKLQCPDCGHSFSEQKLDNPINLLTRKIASALDVKGSQDLILLNSLLHQHIVGIHSVTVIAKRRMLEEHISVIRNDMDHTRNQNLMDQMEKFGVITTKREMLYYGEEETESTVYALRGL